MIELRGITIVNPVDPQKITLTVRGERGDDYRHVDFPTTIPLNEGQIRKFLGDHFNEPPGKIVWPPHIKKPGE